MQSLYCNMYCDTGGLRLPEARRRRGVHDGDRLQVDPQRYVIHVMGPNAVARGGSLDIKPLMPRTRTGE
jgi:hypothetical protein